MASEKMIEEGFQFDFSLKSNKRRRSESVETGEAKSDQDCYESVMRSADPNAPGHVRSSWFNHDFSMSCSDGRNFATQLPNLNSHDATVKREIESLHKQLCQIKRRLGPAAERCTEACNSSVNHRHATTGKKEFYEARRACNPFEKLGEGQNGGLNRMFINRSAMKLANMDAMLDLKLTQYDGEGPFLFADLCAAPGGFSEYILRRCHKSKLPACRGYGMSLLGGNENGRGFTWKLHASIVSAGGSGYHYHTCPGCDGTGDIYRWENVEELRKYIISDCRAHCTQSSVAVQLGKVHLVLADGGFDAQRDSECQEQLTQKLVVCQVGAALSLLREGGRLIVKMFGFQTDVIRTMLTNLFALFTDFKMFKPITSRPASAERYVVFSGFKGTPAGWDGPRWMDKVFSADITMSGTEFCDSILKESVLDLLDRFLDCCDRDMLSLNLKACFSILSYLESKCVAFSKTGFDSYKWVQNGQIIDIDQYELAWQLFF